MKTNMILAAAENGVIGDQNDIPWDIPEDLKRFRELTSGNIVIMGRLTLLSIIDRIGKPLPGRFNIVLSKDNFHELAAMCKEKGFKNVFIVPDLKHAYELAETIAPHWGDRAWVIGGASIYKQARELDIIDEVYLTRVYGVLIGDAIVEIEKLRSGRWNLRMLEIYGDLGYNYEIYERRKLSPVSLIYK
jgi:dihydrofolate reductase